MIKCASVFTYEIDDPDIALEEIKAQLDEKIALEEHTVAVVMCNPEFVTSGVIKLISESLPFPLVGATSSAQAVNGEAGELILTMFVITSDDVRFVIGATGDLLGDVDGPTEAAYRKCSAGEDSPPRLALIFPPLLLEYAGDAYVNAWSKVIPGTPLFGSVATEEAPPFVQCETICDGKTFRSAMTFILCYGNINPRFLVGSLNESTTVPFKGEITKSHGSFVEEINGINAYRYFEERGIAKDGRMDTKFGYVLYSIDQKKREDYDGVPVVRGLASFTEDGTAIFRGEMDEGSTFRMLTSDSADVLKTTHELTLKLGELGDINGVLMFSCIIRRMMTMGSGSIKELELVKNTISPDIPFMMGYAGGEVCPTSIKDGIPTNRFHNFSLVVLAI